MRVRLLIASCVFSLFARSAAAAELLVVVKADCAVSRLGRDEVVNIFMGRYRMLPNGVPALPIDQFEKAERALFYRKLLGKELAEVNAYWARLVFSGKISPPKLAGQSTDVVDWVGSQAGAVGYIRREQLDARVKAVLELP